MFYEIEVFISFPPNLFSWVIRVSILIISVIGIPYTHHDYLPHPTLRG